MADKTPTPEEAITGPAVPEGFSGIKPWVMMYKPAIAALLVGGGIFFFTHPLTTHAAPNGTMVGKVSPVDAGAIVAQPHSTSVPTPHHAAVTQVAATDVTGASSGATATVTLAPSSTVAEIQAAPAQAPQQPVGPGAAMAPAAPATDSPARVAARAQESADRAALDAPLPASAPIAANADRPKDASAYEVAAPAGPFLEPGHIIPITLSTSVDSQIGGGPAMLMGYVGRNVLDYYQRVVLIPHNAKVLGHLVSTQLQPGQNRVGVVWTMILFNGRAIALTGDGVDLTGTVGFSGKVDNHERGELERVLAFSVLAAGAQLAQPQNANNCGGSFGCSPYGWTVDRARLRNANPNPRDDAIQSRRPSATVTPRDRGRAGRS